MNQPLRFHWRLPQGGERPGASRALQASLPETGLPDLEAQTRFCLAAEESGIDSLLTDFGWSKPDSILLSMALGLRTRRIKFIIAYRSGLMCPTTFVQQLNTLSTLMPDRFSINVVAGHSPEEQRYYGDFLPHDERYERTSEFLSVCHAFWRREEVNHRGKYYTVERGRLNTPFRSEERSSPELYIAGNSSAALKLSLEEGSCWMRFPDVPERLKESIAPVLDAGKEVGLRCSIVARPTREEAIQAARELVRGAEPGFNDHEKEKDFVRRSDSSSISSTYTLAESEWLTPWLWTGAIRSHGAPAIALVGTPEEIAGGILEFKEIGISQFIISGWPKLEEMLFFGRHVLPLVRRAESKMSMTEPVCA
jgi:alkanesulfonate monooxygenase